MNKLSLVFLVSLTGPYLIATAQPVGSKFALWDGKESVAEYAKRTKLEPTLTLDLGGVKWEGTLIPAGMFVMGSPPGEAKTEKESAIEKQHTVTISEPFYLGKYELTQAQYEKVMGANPSRTKGANLPVHNVSWQDADDYCTKLSEKVKRKAQLPTEAQWEYACRAGTTTAYHSGNTIADLSKVGWHAGNSGGKLHPGGELMPNAWGLYDMHGNVAEYCLDHYDAKFYATLPTTKPTLMPLKLPSNRRYSYVARGGSWIDPAERCRSAERAYSVPDWQKKDPQAPQSIWWNNADWVGFRVVRAVEEHETLKGMRSKITKESPN